MLLYCNFSSSVRFYTDLFGTSFIMGSKIMDLISLKLISICGGSVMSSSREIFIEIPSTSHTELNQSNTVLVNCFSALYKVLKLSYSVVISLHTASSICHSHTKAATADLGCDNVAVGTTLMLYFWNRNQSEEGDLCFCIGLWHLICCPCYAWTVNWIRLKTQCWSLMLQSKSGENHVESLRLGKIAFWGIGFGSSSKLQLLTALNVFSRLGINLTLHCFIISNCWIARSDVL